MRIIDADDIKYQLLKPNTNPTLWCVSKDAVDLMPTVDAVPVVRCKDCANAMYTENGDIFCDGIRDANWFCADGEKKVIP